MKEKKDWVLIKDFPSYEIHKNNGIRNKATQKFIKGRNWIGYPKVTLMRNGKKHERRIHKLVAEHFIPNPNKLAVVNHKDSDRSNYKYDNLEWMSQSDNMKHRWMTEKMGVQKNKYKPEYGPGLSSKEGKSSIKVKEFKTKGNTNMKAKALEKFSGQQTKGINSLFGRINRARKMGKKFPKKSVEEYLKMKKQLIKMVRRRKNKR